jgi:hypothetical protein
MDWGHIEVHVIGEWETVLQWCFHESFSSEGKVLSLQCRTGSSQILKQVYCMLEDITLQHSPKSNGLGTH